MTVPPPRSAGAVHVSVVIALPVVALRLAGALAVATGTTNVLVGVPTEVTPLTT